MNKKGGVGGVLITIAIVVFIGLILVSAYNIVYPSSGERGTVVKTYKDIESTYLDVSFEYLFGKDFQGSMGSLLGTSNQNLGRFVYDFAEGLVAAILLILGVLIGNILFFAPLFKKTYFLRALIQSRRGIIRYVGLAIVFPVLMQLPIINRIIEVVTFYWFTGFWLYALVLAVYVGYLPELIEAVIRYNEQARAQREIFQTVKGFEIAKATGKAK